MSPILEPECDLNGAMLSCLPPQQEHNVAAAAATAADGTIQQQQEPQPPSPLLVLPVTDNNYLGIIVGFFLGVLVALGIGMCIFWKYSRHNDCNRNGISMAAGSTSTSRETRTPSNTITTTGEETNHEIQEDLLPIVVGLLQQPQQQAPTLHHPNEILPQSSQQVPHSTLAAATLAAEAPNGTSRKKKRHKKRHRPAHDINNERITTSTTQSVVLAAAEAVAVSALTALSIRRPEFTDATQPATMFYAAASAAVLERQAKAREMERRQAKAREEKKALAAGAAACGGAAAAGSNALPSTEHNNRNLSIGGSNSSENLNTTTKHHTNDVKIADRLNGNKMKSNVNYPAPTEDGNNNNHSSVKSTIMNDELKRSENENTNHHNNAGPSSDREITKTNVAHKTSKDDTDNNSHKSHTDGHSLDPKGTSSSVAHKASEADSRDNSINAASSAKTITEKSDAKNEGDTEGTPKANTIEGEEKEHSRAKTSTNSTDKEQDDGNAGTSSNDGMKKEEGDTRDGVKTRKRNNSSTTDKREENDKDDAEGDFEFVVRKVLDHETYRGVQYLEIEWKMDWLNVDEMYKRGPKKVRAYLKKQGLFHPFPTPTYSTRNTSKDAEEEEEVKRIFRHKIDDKGIIYLYAEWNSTWEPMDFMQGEKCTIIDNYIKKHQLQPRVAGGKRQRRKPSAVSDIIGLKSPDTQQQDDDMGEEEEEEEEEDEDEDEELHQGDTGDFAFVVKKVLGHESFRNVQYIQIEWEPDWLPADEMYKRGPEEVKKYIKWRRLHHELPSVYPTRESDEDEYEVKCITKHKRDIRDNLYLFAEWHATWEPVDFMKGEKCDVIDKYIKQHQLMPFLPGKVRGRKRTKLNDVEKVEKKQRVRHKTKVATKSSGISQRKPREQEQKKRPHIHTEEVENTQPVQDKTSLTAKSSNDSNSQEEPRLEQKNTPRIFSSEVERRQPETNFVTKGSSNSSSNSNKNSQEKPPIQLQKGPRVFFDIFVKNVDGRTFTVNGIKFDDKVSSLKAKIQGKIGILPHQQCLMFGGKPLGDERPVKEYYIQQDSTIFLSLRLQAGGVDSTHQRWTAPPRLVRGMKRRELALVALASRFAVLVAMAISCHFLPNHNPGDDVFKFDLNLPSRDSVNETHCFCRSDQACNPTELMKTACADQIVWQNHTGTRSILVAAIYSFFLTPLTRWDASRFLDLAVHPKGRDPPHLNSNRFPLCLADEANDSICKKVFAASEQAHAFFPMLPTIIRTIANHMIRCIPAVVARLLLPPSYEGVAALSALLWNSVCFVITALSLYDLTLMMTQQHAHQLSSSDETFTSKDKIVPQEQCEQLALRAFLLFCFNPASVFFVAAYSESTFALCTFGGHAFLFWVRLELLQKQKDKQQHQVEEGRKTLCLLQVLSPLSALPLWMVASYTRSNGTMNACWLLLQGLGMAFCLWCWAPATTGKHQGGWWKSLGALVFYVAMAVLVALPVIWHDKTGYDRHCSLNQNSNDGEEGGPLIIPSWCVSPDEDSQQPSRFSLYGYVQRQHWNIGLLRYYTVKKIPNFLLASPILLLATMAATEWIHASYSRYTARSKTNNGLLRLVDWAVSSLQASVSWSVPTLGTDSTSSTTKSSATRKDISSPLQVDLYLLAGPCALEHYAVLAALCIVGILVAHIEITTRMICSSSPAIYWYMALCWGSHPDKDTPAGTGTFWPRKRAALSKLIVPYCCLYIVIGVVMHPNWLPWT